MSEVALCEVGDRHNWKYAWFTEHHFLEEYSHISANEVLMPWVLARTQQMHVGSGIINVTPPVNHPARVAERVAMMDHVSSGRFEFGTGRGSSTTEMGGFGITDPEITRDMYDEVIVEFKKMWPTRSTSSTASFFSMPDAQRVAEAVREAAPADVGRRRQPRDVREGRPQMGLGVLCFTGGSPAKMAPLIETYKKTIANAEPVGEYVNDNIAVTTSFMCLEDRDEARDLHDALRQRPPADARVPLPRHVPEAAVRARVADRDPRPDARPTIEKGFQTGAAIVGTPDDCAAGMQKWVDVGVDQLIMGPSGSDVPARAARSRRSSCSATR